MKQTDRQTTDRQTTDRPKQFNELTTVERFIIREYDSWRKSDCDFGYKCAMISEWYDRAKNCEIEHLL